MLSPSLVARNSAWLLISAGQFALNNMISCEDIAGVTLDNVQDLGNALNIFTRKTLILT